MIHAVKQSRCFTDTLSPQLWISDFKQRKKSRHRDTLQCLLPQIPLTRLNLTHLVASSEFIQKCIQNTPENYILYYFTTHFTKFTYSSKMPTISISSTWLLQSLTLCKTVNFTLQHAHIYSFQLLFSRNSLNIREKRPNFFPNTECEARKRELSANCDNCVWSAVGLYCVHILFPPAQNVGVHSWSLGPWQNAPNDLSSNLPSVRCHLRPSAKT